MHSQQVFYQTENTFLGKLRESWMLEFMIPLAAQIEFAISLMKSGDLRVVFQPRDCLERTGILIHNSKIKLKSIENI